MAFPFQWSSLVLPSASAGSTANIAASIPCESPHLTPASHFSPLLSLSLSAHSNGIPSSPVHWNTFRIVGGIQRLRVLPVIVGTKSPEAIREFDPRNLDPPNDSESSVVSFRDISLSQLRGGYF